MKFYNILALAALAYTANADKIKASCRFAADDQEEEAALGRRGGRGGGRGRFQGAVSLYQEINTDEDEPAVLNVSSKDLSAGVIYDLVFLDSAAGSCAQADVNSPVLSFDRFMANRRGKIGVRGLVDENVTLSEDQNGLYAALVDYDDTSSAIACCTLEVETILDDDIEE